MNTVLKINEYFFVFVFFYSTIIPQINVLLCANFYYFSCL
nr:MAG TPA: hypothetical protein [Caudoviricetes sp.]